VSDIVKGLIDGGWALLVGWILPAALDVLLFAFVVYPSVKSSPPFSAVPAGDITLVVAAVVVGVVLSALKTPLYRILEGYVLWPIWLFKWGQQRHIRRRKRLRQIVNYAGYSSAKRNRDEAERVMMVASNQGDQAKVEIARKELDEATGNFDRWASAGILAEEWLKDPANVRVKLRRVRKATADERKAEGNFATGVWSRRPRRQTVVAYAAALPALRRKVLEEKFERYPSDDEEILPTVLGNAIRRFERFGPVHYGLDQQRLWYELMATAPERVGKQVDQMRTAVDFFVSLFFGQLLVAVAAIATACFDPARLGWLGVGALVAVTVAILSYRGAVVTTDEWSYAVQALLNVGRRPLADALSLKLPRELEAEQDMWKLVGQFLRPKPRRATLEELDYYRVGTSPPEEPQTPANS
jgi:hypothetical protein